MWCPITKCGCNFSCVLQDKGYCQILKSLKSLEKACDLYIEKHNKDIPKLGV